LTAIEEQNLSIPIQSPLEVVAKEVKQDDRLCRQVYLTLLSMYTRNPINLAINAPTGEGKSYAVKKVAELFPLSDVIFLTGMTDKALFHRQGVFVTKDENGEYQPIESEISEIDSEIEDTESELFNANDKTLKKGLKAKLKSLQDKKKDLSKSAMKLIDLNHKSLIFLDTPKHTLLQAIMSLLSHDKYEVEYQFVDNFNGIKTNTNVLRGFPTVIFTAAIDYSKNQRWPEIQRRFVITNPKMTAEKYKESIELMGDKYGLPDFVYDATIVSENQKNQAKEMVKELKEKILLISERNNLASPNVFIPFHDSIKKSLPTDKGSDMTTAQRLYNYLTLNPLVNLDKRPRLVTRSEGDPFLKTCPFATFEDLQESVDLMEYSNGVRPYILEWYNEVFLKEYNENKTINNDEDVGSLTTRQLVDATFRIKERKFSTQHILESYIDPLVNAGYIDKIDSKKDKRSYIFYPVLNAKQKKLFDSSETNNSSQHRIINIADPILFPDKKYLISKIEGVLRYSYGRHVLTKLENHEGKEITVEELVDQYYKDPDTYFEVDNNSKPPSSTSGQTVTAIAIARTSIVPKSAPPLKDENNIIKEAASYDYPSIDENEYNSQQNKENDVQYIENTKDQSTKLLDETKTNNFVIFQCYHCDDFHTNIETEYQRHVVINHRGKPAYPSKADADKYHCIHRMKRRREVRT
jgi:hypothetical protein